MRTRQIKTQADVDRYIAKGYGAGERDAYIPWIKVRDIASRGRSREVHGSKTNRVHHLQSDLEYWYWLTLEFSEQVVDIREQYPLFPSSESMAIASSLGIEYPKYPGTNVMFVLPTDVLVTLKQPDGKFRLAARTLKYQAELDDPKTRRRTLEKFELERAIWRSRGVSDWAIVTDQVIGKTLAANLQWLRKAAHPQRHLLQPALRKAYKDYLKYYCNAERTLASVIRSAATAVTLPYDDGVMMFKDLVWTKEVLVNLRVDSLALTGPCPSLSFPAPVVTEKVA